MRVYAREDGASLDIDFYYMANAIGRLLGTVLSGWLFQVYGLVVCLLACIVSDDCYMYLHFLGLTKK
tara:strand:- start:7140 stop:7340 length:201 start_codon:yes stop_codon:yes gene_type:complete